MQWSLRNTSAKFYKRVMISAPSKVYPPSRNFHSFIATLCSVKKHERKFIRLKPTLFQAQSCHFLHLDTIKKPIWWGIFIYFFWKRAIQLYIKGARYQTTAFNIRSIRCSMKTRITYALVITSIFCKLFSTNMSLIIIWSAECRHIGKWSKAHCMHAYMRKGVYDIWRECFHLNFCFKGF